MGSAHISAKAVRSAKKRKGIEAQRVNPVTPSWAVDTLIEDEEQNRTEDRRKKQSKSLTQLPMTIQPPPATHRDHTMSLFILHTQPTGGVPQIIINTRHNPLHNHRVGTHQSQENKHQRKNRSDRNV